MGRRGRLRRAPRGCRRWGGRGGEGARLHGRRRGPASWGPGAAERLRAAARTRHGRAGLHRGRARPAAARPAPGPRAHRQGPLHAAAADGARGRRAGQPPPRRARHGRGPGRRPGGRGRPALGAARGGRRGAGRAPQRPDRLRHDRRRRAPGGLLAHGLDAPLRPLAGRHDHGGPGLRRRPRGRERPHRAARGGARPRRRRRGRDPGPRQRGHGHAVGLLRDRRGGGAQRRARARRPPRRLTARLGRRRAPQAPRDLAPQPHGIRARGPRPGHGARAAARGGDRRPRRSQAQDLADTTAGRLRWWTCPWRASTRPSRGVRSGSRRWAAGWTRTAPPSSPRLPQGGMPRVPESTEPPRGVRGGSGGGWLRPRRRGRRRRSASRRA